MSKCLHTCVHCKRLHMLHIKTLYRCCTFLGRWGLPIPYRTPMLGVAGEMIQVDKIENPTKEDIAKLLTVLEERIKETFDTHKAAYDWENVELVIK